jgi:poly(3-hydroxybutyrate) depolymerase
MKRSIVAVAALCIGVFGCVDEDSITPAATAGSGAGTGSGGATSSSGMAGAGGSGAGSATGGGGAGGGTQGCGDVGAPTGNMTGSVQVAGETRTYVLSVPNSYDPNIALPIVFAWHGRGGDGALARLYFGVEGQSNGQAIFVYPDGGIVQGGQTGWDLTTTGNDVAFFDAMLADLSQTYCVDEGRVFSTGHSFGGYFSNTLGCARANVLRAIAPVAGGGPFGGGCSGAVAAWITHGSADTTVPLSQGEGSRDHWQTENGCGSTTMAVSPSPCVAYDGCQSGADLHWCEHTGGHMWPSFAAAAIWDFFASMQ